MPSASLNDVPESPEQRMQRRRVRRWKRRMRMAGPFVGISLLLGTLSLSVDLIEYEPQPEAERLSDRPMPARVIEKSPAARRTPSARSVSGSSVVETGANEMAPSQEIELQLEGGTERDSAREFAPPPRPYALGNAAY